MLKDGVVVTVMLVAVGTLYFAGCKRCKKDSLGKQEEMEISALGS